MGNSKKYKTQFPNYIGLTNAEDAALEINQYIPLFSIQCSEHLADFLCALYFPKCDDVPGILPPCQSLCQSVYDGCYPVMNNFSWPDKLRCDKFPDSYDSEVCFGTVMSDQDTTTLAPTTLSSAAAPPTSGAPSSAATLSSSVAPPTSGAAATQFPNYVGLTNAEDAALEINQYIPLFSIQCSEHLADFLCALYFPKCDDVPGILPPCQSLCQSVYDGCYPVMNNFGFPWPDKLICDTFPDSYDSEVCFGTVMSDQDTTTPAPTTLSPSVVLSSMPTSTASSQQCQDIRVSDCQGLSYSQTGFPNLFGHQTQEEAQTVLQEYSLLLLIDCYEHLNLAICAALFPRCVNGSIIPPCQSLCRGAQEGCSAMLDHFNQEWPEELECSTFPDANDEDVCVGYQPVVCQNPGSVASATLSVPLESYPVHVGTALTIECDSGYILSGASTLTCTSDGTWNLPLPSCVSNCNDPGTIAHGFQVGTPSYEAFTIVTYMCDAGYHLSGAHVLTCLEGEWSHPLPQCLVFCEVINAPFCLHNLPYFLTGFPNFAGHSSQQQSNIYLEVYKPIMSSDCYEHLQLLLCTAFMPPCRLGQIQPPCRSFCEEGLANCLQVFQDVDLPWPQELNCSVLPSDSSCVHSPSLPTTQPPFSTKLLTESVSTSQLALSPQCEDITVSFCQGLSYSQTGFPNMFGHQTQEEAEVLLQEYILLTLTNCYEHLNLAICATLFPPCVNDNIIPPCQSLCRGVQEGCGTILDQYNYEWPEEFECSNFPDEDNEDVCIGYQPEVTTATSESTSKRGDIRCQGDYHLTYCKNDGICYVLKGDDGTQEMYCLCSGNFTGQQCEKRILTKAEQEKLEEEAKKEAISLGIGISVACIIGVTMVIVLVLICRKHVSRKSRYLLSRPDIAVFTNPAYDEQFTDGKGSAVKSKNKDSEAVQVDVDPVTEANQNDNTGGPNGANVNGYNGPYQEEPRDAVLENKYAECDDPALKHAPFCEPVEDVPSSPGCESAEGEGQRLSAVWNPHYQELDGTQKVDSEYMSLDKTKTTD
uniref:Uncharacterized protein LOC102805162 n=1 Tax=Saccoglossus kowalevskii TaxID=10224 RepID=A0ABM0MHG8_SACKO|nr:PREDICTED: uncharacterized protein LOC102805162 [Saccoglossus kowalevskii]